MPALNKLRINGVDYDISGGGGGSAVTSVNGKTGAVTLNASDVGALPSSTPIPDELSDLQDDATHRTVTDTEKAAWNGKADTSDIPTKTSDLDNDSGFITGLTVLTYNSSTWNDFITAFNANKIVYCRVPTGNDARYAFLAYYNGPEPSAEFQYYRSVRNHSQSAQGDEVYIYKLMGDGTWSTTTRKTYSNVNVSSGIKNSYYDYQLHLSIDSAYASFTNYYTKTDVDNLISAITTVSFEIVQTLPSTGEANVIYLVPKATAQTQNVYDEYIYTNNAWEKIGDTEIDLSGYYTKAEANALLENKVDKVSGKGLSTNDYTTEEKDKLAGIASGAEVNVQSDWNEGDNSKDDFIKNKPTSLPASDVYAWAKASTKPTYTKSEVGLGNVPDVATNDQTPTFTQASSRANIVSGEKLSVILGKIMKWFADLKTVAFSGSYNDLSDKPYLPSMPTDSGVDCNNCKDTGFYHFSSNGPYTNSWGSLIVVDQNGTTSGGTITQIAQCCGPTAYIDVICIRRFYNSAWTSWVKLPMTSDIPTNTNQLTNGAGFITSSGSCAYAANAGKVNNHTVATDVPANAVFTDTNTWRPVVDNLTSTDTDKSLTANQGKVLKGYVDDLYDNLDTKVNKIGPTSSRDFLHTLESGDTFRVLFADDEIFKVTHTDVYLNGQSFSTYSNTISGQISTLSGKYTNLYTNKQDKLVSGTNIKTVNGTSLLGSGNVTVQETLVSGTNIKTINNESILGSGNITIAGSGLSATVLWTNSSVTADFASQTVTLSQALSNFDYYSVVCKRAKSNPQYLSTGLIPVISADGTGTTCRLYNPAECNYMRQFNTDHGTGTSFKISTCGKFATYGSTNQTTANNYLIPWKIIGFK